MEDTKDDPVVHSLSLAPWASWLSRRRWFAGKSGNARISLESTLAVEGVHLCLVRSGEDLYFAPIGPVEASRDALFELEGRAYGDALESESCVRSLLRLCCGATLSGGNFGIVGTALEPRSLEVASRTGEVVLGSPDQTNSWARVGGEFLKVFRRLEVEPNLDVEVLRALAHRSDLSIPRLRGSLSLTLAGSTPVAIAVQGCIVHQGNAWERACAEVASVAAGAEVQVDGWRLLGRRTGELHRAMADELGARIATAEDAAAISRGAAGLARAILADLGGADRRAWSGETAALAERVLSGGGRLAATLDAPLPASLPIQRVHGDYHLGQVLAVDGDWVILDFEGEPARTPHERRAMAAPAKDVSGMLRSFEYAARAGLPASAFNAGLEAVASWLSGARGAFLEGYFASPGLEDLWPRASAEREAVLALYESEKAFYELRYELAHRPDWMPIPLSGLATLAERVA